MSAKKINKVNTHVVDILGNVKGRDQPIMLMDKAHELVSTLPKELFLDDEVVFFDPFCKAGEILLACAFNSCIHKSESGSLHDIEKIKKELYQSKKYFGLAPDERHHRLSLRTFLGNENSHKKEFNHIIKNGNYLSEEDGKLDKEKYQKEFDHMIDYIKQQTGKKRIIAVGNPPYQENDGGGNGTSARPIYNYFLQALIECHDIEEFVVVIPSRWFVGGKGLDSFRSGMMSNSCIKNIVNFEKSGTVFPSVDIDGGVCFVNYSKKYSGNINFVSGLDQVSLDPQEFDVIPDDPKSIPILNKVVKKWNGEFIGDIARSRNHFKISTQVISGRSGILQSDNLIKCITRNKNEVYIEKSQIKSNFEDLRLWKVCIPKAYGGRKGQRRITMPARSFFLVNPGDAVSETYSIINMFEDKKKATNFLNFLKTDFSRYLLGLRKITQNVSRNTWSWIPMLDMETPWNDEKLFKFFKIKKNEIEHILKKIREWS